MEVRQTQEFQSWLTELRDLGAAYQIAARIRRLELGNPGDAKSAGESVSELRVDYGPGYRIYFTQSSSEIFILLCGGDKRTQIRDISASKENG